jgi:hypothetical protein
MSGALRLHAIMLAVYHTAVVAGCIAAPGDKQVPVESSQGSPAGALDAAANTQAALPDGRWSSIALGLETAHFQFYCREQDRECLDDLSETLESSYGRITSDLRHAMPGRTVVEIYHDTAEVAQVTGLACVGTAKSGRIQIASPLRSGIPRQLMRVIVTHEFAHIVSHEINRTLFLCSWLSEGVAEYEAGGPPTGEIRRSLLSQMVRNGWVPSMDQLHIHMCSSDDLYACAYALVEFIVGKYGYDGLLRLVESPAETQKALGISEGMLYENWIDYLSQEYGS